jgi:hypothetical protein
MAVRTYLHVRMGWGFVPSAGLRYGRLVRGIDLLRIQSIERHADWLSLEGAGRGQEGLCAMGRCPGWRAGKGREGMHRRRAQYQRQ